MKKYLPYFYRIPVLFILLFSGNVHGQSIFSNTITGTNPNLANPYTLGQVFHSSLTVSGIGRGSGIAGANANDRYNASGWDSATLDRNDYFEFTLIPNSNYQINFSSFVYTGQVSGTGPGNFALRSSIDNYTSNIGSPNAAGLTIDLSDSIFQNVTTGVTFRLYGWGASSSAGTFSINDFIFNGSVTSTFIKPEPSGFPGSFVCGATSNKDISLSWIDASGGTVPDGYLIQWSSNSFAAITDPTDGLVVSNSESAQNIPHGVQNVTITGLASNTAYYFKIWSYTNSGSAIDYKLGGEPQTVCSTLSDLCDFSEGFSNLPTLNQGMYQDRTWAGAGGTWTATETRTDQILNGKAIATNSDAVISAPPINNGIGVLKFDYVRAFTGTGARKIQVWVNGAQAGGDITVNPSSDVVQSYSVNLNIPGNVQLELRTSGAQIKIDDVSWNCFSGTSEPRINLQGNGITIPNGNLTTSMADGTDFGTNIIAGTDVEKIFIIQNQGSGNLTLNTTPFVQLAGANGFVVSAQPAAASMAGFSSQTFKIKFNSTVPGVHTETVRIGSSDPLTPVYSFNISAAVLSPSITSDKSVMTAFTYAFGQGPSGRQSFVVNGSNLANDITVTASANWEISTNLTYDGVNVSPWNSIVLSKTAGNTVNNRQIYVRLKDGLPSGNYTGTVTLISLSAPSVFINLNGSVTAGIASIKVTGNGTAVANGSASPNGLNNTLFASQNLGNSQTKSFVITNSGGAPLTINTLSISAGDAASFTILNPPLTGTVLNANETTGFDVKFSPNSVGTKNATISIVNSDPDDNPYTFAVQGGATFCSSPGDLIIAKQDFETTPAAPVLAYTLSNIGIPGSNTGFSSGSSGNNAAPKSNNLYSEGARGYRIQGGDPGSVVTSGVQFNFNAVDTSAYTDLKLTLKVAGYSIGSTTNGMDCNGAAGGDVCVPNDQKSDFVLVEISPDGGVTWYPQAKAVAGEMNVAWSFGSKGTALGSRNYTTDNNLTYFNSTAALQYSAIVINNLPAVPQLKIRITAQNNALNESWVLDDIRITSTGLIPKVWNGSAWLPSPPQSTDRAVIDGDYITATHGVFQVCQCEVKSGSNLTVSENTAVTVTDALKNDGHILVESNGGLVQLNDTNTNSGTGSFTAERKIKLSVPAAPLTDRSQYNYLISPVAGANLKTGIYNGISAPYALYYNQSNNYFYESSGAYIPGRALAVKEPSFAAVPSPVNEVKAVFNGVPVNGTSVQGIPLTYDAVNTNPGVESPSDALRGYHLIGNPYPSNMDLVTFYNQNGGQAGGISSTFYFWDNTANNTYVQYGSGYSGKAYAQFNAVSLTPVKATGDAGFSGIKTPTRYIAMGQGFMTRVLVAAKTLTFSNSTRKTDAATAFFGKNTTEMNRFWLNMITPSHLASNIAVVYFEEGDNAFAADDSPVMGGSDVLYSLAGDKQVSINGRSSFVQTDVVKLGSNYFVAGNYTISIDKTEGVFSGGQKIYLKDRKTGIITDLIQASYTFAANAGEDTGRFEIIYQPETVLATDASVKEELQVYRDGSGFVVKASSKKITGLEVYDASGKLIYSMQPNSTKAVIDAAALTNGMYVIKINQNGQITAKKIIK